MSSIGFGGSVVVVWIGLSIFPCLLAAAEAKEDVQLKESELSRLQGSIERLQTELQTKESQQQALVEELRSAEQAIGRSVRRLRSFTETLQQQERRLNTLAGERDIQQDALQIERTALALQLRAAYVMGRQQRLKILLNQQDPAAISRMMVYYDYLNRARAERMARISQVIEELARIEAEIAGESRRLHEMQRQELEEKSRLEQERTRREEVILALKEDIRSQDDRLTGLKMSEQQLQDLIGKLQEELISLPLSDASQRPFKSSKGKLIWPAKGRLTAGFGSRKAGNLKWDGVLISAPEGNEVRAVHRGRVAFADWLRGFGLLLIVDHSNGYMTLYGHNQSLFKETGEWVEAGEPVALIGNSGGHLNTGVYFGIRYKGRAVNPKKWCRRVKGNRVGQRLLPLPVIDVLLNESHAT